MLDQLAEDVETFQRRRVRHLVAQLGADVRPWWIVRAAGLKTGKLALVEDELQRMTAAETV